MSAALRRCTNVAAFFALMQPGATFIGLNLAAGGIPGHGSPVKVSGKWFKAVLMACAATTTA